MKICITGATGFTGGHVMARMLADGHQVVAYVRSVEKLHRMLQAHGLSTDSVTHVVGDLTDDTAVGQAIAGCDAVVHTAAAVALTPDALEEIGRVNTKGTELVLKHAMKQACDPIVHFSSIAALFPPQGTVLRATDPVPETSLPYSASKGHCEKLARGMQDQGAPVVIVYPGGILGPVDAGNHVVGDGWAKALEPGFMPVISEGGTSYIDVRDLAAITSAVMRPSNGPRRFMAGGRYITWEESADFFDVICGKKWKRRNVPGALLRFVGKAGDALGRIRAGFVPPVGYEAAMSMTNAVPTDDSAVLSELGISYRPLQQTMEETMQWLVAQGRISPEQAPRWAEEAPK